MPRRSSLPARLSHRVITAGGLKKPGAACREGLLSTGESTTPSELNPLTCIPN
jgi:hypothetical protein